MSLSKNEKLLDGITSIAGSQYAEINAMMGNAMARFTKGVRSGNQIEMHKAAEMAMAAAGGALLLKGNLQTASRLMLAIAREKR